MSNENLRKHSFEAEELLSNAELYEIKAGKGSEQCRYCATTCISTCTTCTFCATNVMHIFRRKKGD